MIWQREVGEDLKWDDYREYTRGSPALIGTLWRWSLQAITIKQWLENEEMLKQQEGSILGRYLKSTSVAEFFQVFRDGPMYPGCEFLISDSNLQVKVDEFLPKKFKGNSSSN